MNILGNGVIRDSVGQVGQVVKQVAKQIVNSPVELIKETSSQIAKTSTTSDPEAELKSQEQTREFVKNLYAYSSGEDAPPMPDMDSKNAEDEKHLAKLRQILHSEYYQKLITRQKTMEEVEKPAERIERLEEQDLQKKEEKKQKKKPISVDRAERSTEANRGVSG